MAEDPNIALVQRFFAAYADHDFEAMRNEILAPEVTWSIRGHHPLAGIKRGANEILAYFAELPRANFQAEPIVIAAEGDYVVDVHRGWAAYEDDFLDMHWVLVYRIESGRIREVENFAADQHAADAFFWRVWGDKLAPLPARIARSRAKDTRGHEHHPRKHLRTNSIRSGDGGQNMTRVALGVAAATITVAIALAALSRPSQGASTRTQATNLTLPAPVRCFRNAVNRAALTALLNCFAPRGVVIDVSRRFAGRAAIRTWASSEFIGGRLTIIRRVARPRNPNGLTLLVRFAPRGSGGFFAHYRFVTRNGKLILVDMQYPD